jgi:hypothetical protein
MIETAGRASNPSSPKHQSKWRMAAQDRRRTVASPKSTMRSVVPLKSASNQKGMFSGLRCVPA